ncbi:MAG: recombinase family protein [Alphaproteobacteria bacterium]|nr:recombinase family protein [Alphaproteobacteria bacterium]
MTGHSDSISRFAIYARYSSPLQEMTSISGQLRLCRDRVATLGGVIADEYTDPELSGTAMQLRPGLRQLIEDARARRFDAVYVEALDRLARSQADMAWLYRELRFLGIDLYSLEDGQVDSLHAGIKAIVSEMFIDNIGNKTRRGQNEAVHDRRLIGSSVYGYRIANRISGSGKPVRGLRTVEPAEAEVVRRIYRLYLDGMSPTLIVRLLNREGVPGPDGGAWESGIVRGHRHNGILRNELYCGRVIRGRTRSRRHPDTGRRHFDPLPREEWTVIEAPELRIVDDETFQAVQDEVQRRRSRHHTVVTPQRKAAYPLTARVHCGLCGSHMIIADRNTYRCVVRRRDPQSCANGRGIALEDLEHAAARQLFGWLLSRDRDWRDMFAAAGRENAERRRILQERAGDAADGIARLLAVIESGIPSTSIGNRVLELERARNEALAELEGMPEPPPPASFDVRAFMRGRVRELRRAVTRNRRSGQREQALLTVRDLIARIEVRPSDGPERVEVETVPDIPAIVETISRHVGAGERGA